MTFYVKQSSGNCHRILQLVAKCLLSQIVVTFFGRPLPAVPFWFLTIQRKGNLSRFGEISLLDCTENLERVLILKGLGTKITQKGGQFRGIA